MFSKILIPLRMSSIAIALACCSCAIADETRTDLGRHRPTARPTDLNPAANSTPPPVNAPRVNLPECIDSQRSLVVNGEEISDPVHYVDQWVRNNKGTSGGRGNRYQGFRNVLNAVGGVTEREELARLIYAETLATASSGSGCTDQFEQSIPNIAAVLHNRIRARNGDISSVVYQCSQFSSSMHSYFDFMGADAEYKAVLCPEEGHQRIWDLATYYANLYLDNPDSNPLHPNAHHYYFCQHFDSAQAEQRFGYSNCDPWGYPEVTQTQSGEAFSEAQRSCIKIFRNDDWSSQTNVPCVN